MAPRGGAKRPLRGATAWEPIWGCIPAPLYLRIAASSDPMPSNRDDEIVIELLNCHGKVKTTTAGRFSSARTTNSSDKSLLELHLF
jgi:hypothetical protein